MKKAVKLAFLSTALAFVVAVISVMLIAYYPKVFVALAGLVIVAISFLILFLHFFDMFYAKYGDEE